MSKCLTVKNAVFGRLKANKGNKSYSELLEQIMNKAGIPPLQVSQKEADVIDNTYPISFKAFALSEMSVRPNTIRMWANQDQDKELKELAQMVIEAGS